MSPRTRDGNGLGVEQAREFAEEWYSAWNAHDLDRILAHYREDVRLSSPLVPRLTGQRALGVIGRSALASYFQRGLDAYPDLRFQPIALFVGAESVVLHYLSVRGAFTAEAMVLDREMRVWKANAHYERLPSAGAGRSAPLVLAQSARGGSSRWTYSNRPATRPARR